MIFRDRLRSATQTRPLLIEVAKADAARSFIYSPGLCLKHLICLRPRIYASIEYAIPGR